MVTTKIYPPGGSNPRPRPQPLVQGATLLIRYEKNITIYHNKSFMHAATYSALQCNLICCFESQKKYEFCRQFSLS